MPSPLAAALPPLLRTARFGRALRWMEETGSTNADALRWAEAGAPEGALVGAEHQTAGRGRHGRGWADAPGLGLLCSLVLRPTLPAERLGLVPLAAGVAVAEAVAAWVAPIAPALKWPNDVLLGGRKVAGVLVEGHVGRGGAVLALGIGLNVNASDFPPDLAERATSLALEAGRPVPRAPLLADLLRALEKHYDSLYTDDGAAVRAAFEACMAGRGDTATVSSVGHGRAMLSGRALGVDPSGALRLATPEGVRLVAAGEVTLNGSHVSGLKVEGQAGPGTAR